MNTAESSLEKLVGDLKNTTKKHAINTSAEEISDYFHEVRDWLTEKGVANGKPAPWHHLPERRYDLITHVLTRGPTIVGLRPESAKEFKRRYGIKAETIVKLAQQGAVLGDIYIRDVEEWKIKEKEEFMYLYKLLRDAKDRKSIVLMKGEIVDHYMETKYSGFDKKRSDFSSLWGEIIKKYPGQKNAVIRVIEEGAGKLETKKKEKELNQENYLDMITKPLSHSHAYVASFDNQGADHVCDLMKSGKLRKAAEVLYTYKRYYASPTTAAIGGTFYWTKQHKEMMERNLDVINIDGEIRHLHNNQSIGWREEVQKFAKKYFLQHVPCASDDMNDELILDILKNSELNEINAKIQEFEDAIVESFVSGSQFLMSEDDLAYCLDQRQKIFRNFEKGGVHICAAAVTALILIDPVLEHGFKAATMAPTVGKVSGRVAHRLAHRQSHRLIKAASNLKSTAQAS